MRFLSKVENKNFPKRTTRRSYHIKMWYDEERRNNNYFQTIIFLESKFHKAIYPSYNSAIYVSSHLIWGVYSQILVTFVLESWKQKIINRYWSVLKPRKLFYCIITHRKTSTIKCFTRRYCFWKNIGRVFEAFVNAFNAPWKFVF